MEPCIDDLLHHDTDLEEHWWRTIKLLIHLAESGVVLNPENLLLVGKGQTMPVSELLSQPYNHCLNTWML